MAAAMGGLDVLAFTGGVGEHSVLVRERAAEGLAFLGVTIEPARNRAGAPDREIGGGGRNHVFVIASREELEIAAQVRRVMAAPA